LNGVYLNSLNVKERKEGRGSGMTIGRVNSSDWERIEETRGKKIKARKFKIKRLPIKTKYIPMSPSLMEGLVYTPMDTEDTANRYRRECSIMVL
jgi:hypothetical protein